MKEAKIVIVAPVHQWDDVRVYKKEAVSLARHGYDVTLVGKATKSFVENGVKVIPAAGCYRNRLARFLSLLFVFFQSIRLKGDLYHIHNPDTIPLGFFLKLLGKKVIYDTHEDFSKRILMRGWLPRPIRHLVAFLVSNAEKFIGYFIDATIVTQEEILSRLKVRSYLIGNPPRVDHSLKKKIKSFSKDIIRNEGEFRLIYIGGISKTRGLFHMVSALKLLNERAISARLWLIGPANEKELEAARNIDGWQYVDYLPRMSQENAFAYVEKSDVGLIYIDDVGDYSSASPNKLYEYMSLGKPFVSSDFEKWRCQLKGVNAGVFIKPGSSMLLSDAIASLWMLGEDERNKLGIAGRRYVVKNSWENEFNKIEKLYNLILQKGDVG